MPDVNFYIEAYDKDEKQILGNLDGQAALRVKDYKLSYLYKKLTRGLIRAPRVKFWLVVDRGGHYREAISNPHFNEPTPRVDEPGDYV